ncbi:MAG: hypothetical protein ABI647_09270 [Gemmatimonadota bacterium]
MMRQLWVFGHLLGFVMWLGGALGAMAVGIAARREPPGAIGTAVRLQGAIYRRLVLPGSLLTVISGLILTMTLYSAAGAMAAMSPWVAAMQGFGLLAAIVTLTAVIPASARLTRLDPADPQFAAFRRRQIRFGMVSSTLGLLALISGALIR